MSPTLTTFLYEAANFLVFAAVLGWLFFKPVRKALSDRRARFEAEAELADQKLAAAERGQQEIDAARASLKQELQNLRGEERERARAEAAELIADARRTAEQELQAARRQAGRIPESQRDALARAAAAAAADTVGALLEELAGRDLQTALIDSACQQLRLLSSEGLAPVKVESSVPLSPEQRRELEDALGPAAGEAQFQTTEELAGGVRVSTGNGLIDASVLGLSRFARQALMKEIRQHANHQPPLETVHDA